MLVKTYGSAVQGIKATTITIEVSVSQGINFFLVGLPDSAVRESQQRIATAFESIKQKMPKKRVVINMAPADIRKEGAAYDLPLAVGIMAASGIVTSTLLGELVIMGELSLDGTLNPIKGILPIAIQAREEGFTGLIVPKNNAREAAVVNDLNVYGVENLNEVVDFLNGTLEIAPTIEIGRASCRERV